LLLPEIDLVGMGGRVVEGSSLPQSEVGILHCQFPWVWGFPASTGPIEGIQLFKQPPNRHSVRHDVVNVDDYDVFGFTELEKPDAKQWKTRQVERFDRMLPGQGPRAVFAFRAMQVIQSDDIDVDFE